MKTLQFLLFAVVIALGAALYLSHQQQKHMEADMRALAQKVEVLEGAMLKRVSP
jgi:uncharacterized protein HemX